MLSLDDPRWKELAHAYGAASDIPDLLHALRLSPAPAGLSAEPFFSLWSSLCHQGDAYGASYAAVPHIVDIGLSAAGPIDFSFFLLPAAIEVARSQGRAPAIPGYLMEGYQTALALLGECVAARVGEPWDQDTTIAVSAALAVAKGHYRLAEAVMNLDEDLIAKINDGEWD